MPKNDKESPKKTLKKQVEHEVRKVFRTALTCIEMRFGDDFDGFPALRAQILRVGNDAIRELSRIIDEEYNLQIIPGRRVKEVFRIDFLNQEGIDGGDANGD